MPDYILSFGDGQGFNKWYICKDAMKIVKRTDKLKKYRTWTTDFFIRRYLEYRSRTKIDDLVLNHGNKQYKCSIKRSNTQEEQEPDDEVDGMPVILFSRTIISIYVFGIPNGASF